MSADEAMRALYGAGAGEVYLQAVRWLETADDDLPLLSTALLAIGNFARDDRYCLQMMGNNIYDKLLDIFETYYEKGAGAEVEVERVQHGALAALRNLSVPAQNKVRALARGRAVPLLARALAGVRHHHVAYKLLAALRMLLDGHGGGVRGEPGGHGGDESRGDAARGAEGADGAGGEGGAGGEAGGAAGGAAGGGGAGPAGVRAGGRALRQAGRGRGGGAGGAAGGRVRGGAGAGAGDAGLAGAGVHLALRRFVSVREDLPAELMRRFDKIIATISDHAEGTSS
ncbi:Rap1 GTPase-GDP dissociation stimulator 1-A [Papilio machaon]|uniref:Rap1 GTPase-GDP dissociation stimulator 1-A n=1 Tax=Papilio machaon TaxID=76193 RepID=A0A194RE41_PAPMA|nr:Rap1 GTPase-GDP dissociation stimulator 1-A [Papilio machaon]